MFALSLSEIGLYSFALLLLFITPGPVWVALIARSLKSGFAGAWPLALGVALGDICWPALALLSLGQIVSLHGDIIFWLRYIAVAVFAGMGIGLYLAPVQPLQAESKLTKEGVMAGFLAGLMVIIGNPKAMLFYIGILPGFFDVSRLQIGDIILIALISALVPFIGNLILGLAVGRARQLISSVSARRRLNQVSGVILILVGGLILVT
ncbi:MAG: LysE family translocator, partial [Candidatus Puniceispirillaceae bacterium]